MKADLYSVENGSNVGSLEVADNVFANAVNDHLIYEAIRAELANARQGTADTRERAEIHGSGSKPYRQKGIGRARAGTKKSPIWAGGGTVFGPHPRDYSIKLPRKKKRKAMTSLLSKKNADGSLVFVDNFKFDSGKTKDVAKLIANVADKDRVFFIVKNEESLVKRAAKNIPWLRCFSSNRLVFKDLFYAKKVVITKGAAQDMAEMFSSVVRKGAQNDAGVVE